MVSGGIFALISYGAQDYNLVNRRRMEMTITCTQIAVKLAAVEILPDVKTNILNLLIEIINGLPDG